MKRRDFFNTTTLALTGSLVWPFTTKPKPPGAKVCLIGVGTSACRIAAKICGNLRFSVNYHGIDSTNNVNSEGNITCWYESQITSRFLPDQSRLEEQLAADWNHNIARPYFQSQPSYITGDIILLANMGGKTGSHAACMLAQYLDKIPGNRVRVVASMPYGFTWHPTGTNLAAKCVNVIREAGVPVTVLYFPEIFKNTNLFLKECYHKMDEILIENMSAMLGE
ncbi:FtsZ/tubulin family protein [Mucilaginibacter psychrotolerans]|uniref:Uncharacterized protein n=1 Tax=Mucilaginibacter psychrotolerans TaxID=1524096 RepID=A0A4Y8SJR1_9SPHI|nr:hypothetical protein [Mucilaginibacter psychrotolerans]TFF38767.1 hypothetical protein E2R66_07105 [Mucilaginibacter psychrotolerans]